MRSDDEVARTPDPPDELTYEEGIGWRYGWLDGRDAIIDQLVIATSRHPSRHIDRDTMLDALEKLRHVW